MAQNVVPVSMIWGRVNQDTHPCDVAAAGEITNPRVITVAKIIIRALFPGIEYDECSEDVAEVSALMDRVLKVTFSQLVGAPADAVKCDDVEGVKVFLPCNGEEWRSSAWKLQYEALLALF